MSTELKISCDIEEVERIAMNEVLPFSHWSFDTYRDRFNEIKANPMTEHEHLNMIQMYGKYRESLGFEAGSQHSKKENID